MAQCRSALRAIGIVLVAFVGTGAGFQPSALPFAGLLAGPSHMHSLRLACGHHAMQNSARLHKNGASRPLEVRMEASSPQAADGRLSTQLSLARGLWLVLLTFRMLSSSNIVSFLCDELS